MNRYQFSIRELFRLTTIAAVLLAVMRLDPPWFCMLVGVTALAAAFVAAQILVTEMFVAAAAGCCG